jgi:hypothetical protein
MNTIRVVLATIIAALSLVVYGMAAADAPGLPEGNWMGTLTIPSVTLRVSEGIVGGNRLACTTGADWCLEQTPAASAQRHVIMGVGKGIRQRGGSNTSAYGPVVHGMQSCQASLSAPISRRASTQGLIIDAG